MPKIKRVGNKDFTIVENSCLRDPNLGLEERGLLVTMLSLPDNWDFSGMGLTSILPCGKTKVFNTLNKLESAGYLRRTRIYENGKLSDWLYEISGTPIFLENSDLTDEPLCQGQDASDLFPGNLEIGFLEEEKQEEEKQDQENRYDNKINNNKTHTNQLFNNQESNNQSINLSKQDLLNYDSLNDNSVNRLTERLKDSRHFFSPKESAEICIHFPDYEACKSVIKQNISYETLAASADTEILDEIVDVMANIVAFAKTPIKINGDKIPAEVVAERFMSLDPSDIEYVLDTLHKNTAAVKNIRAYLITTLYNSKSTLNTYYQTEMQHDFYGSG